jgi:hypothetical protein
VPGAVAFLLGEGRVRYRTPEGEGTLEVPPARTVVLTPAVEDVRTDAWVFSASFH